MICSKITNEKRAIMDLASPINVQECVDQKKNRREDVFWLEKSKKKMTTKMFLIMIRDN